VLRNWDGPEACGYMIFCCTGSLWKPGNLFRASSVEAFVLYHTAAKTDLPKTSSKLGGNDRSAFEEDR
jgi:hypothetical protein